MSKIKKCIITKYDKTITELPFLTIPVDKVAVEKPDEDCLGEEFANRLRIACHLKGYVFKFYTLSSDKEYDYELIVYN